ncbi:MAG: hypothetical protein IPJ89_04470 [Candidatus Iainarchaeum archaeon]|uniref:Uncharacterized protein n=1 Tax=Candidatus Iainarchaeum sp. TaxID=3101447 RepID=A0A7T9DJC0_9ARCH|nr:MAG: hypothetical protein IPJ89_04470 [Candidatus Diapherotrites archaeon]
MMRPHLIGSILLLLLFAGLVHASEINLYAKLDTSLQTLIDADRDIYYKDVIKIFPEGGDKPIYTIEYDYVGSPNYHKLTISKLGQSTPEIKYFGENLNGGSKFSIFGGDTIEGQFDNYEFGSKTAIYYMKLQMSEKTIAGFNAYFSAEKLAQNPSQKEMEFSAKQDGTTLQFDTATKRFSLLNDSPVVLTIQNTTGKQLLIGTNYQLPSAPTTVPSATKITDPAKADIPLNGTVELSACTQLGVANTCVITIEKINGKAIKDIDFSSGLGITVTRDSDGDDKFSAVDSRTITLNATESYVVAAQGNAPTLTQLKRIGTTNQFELAADQIITVGFQGAKKDSEKFVSYGTTPITDFTSAARSAKTIGSDLALTTGAIYRVTDAFTFGSVGGKTIRAAEGFELTYYINLDNDPAIAANEKQTITFLPKKSIDAQFFYEDNQPITKSQEDQDTYLLEKDAKIRIQVKGMKEDKSGNIATATLVNGFSSESGLSFENYINTRSVVATPAPPLQGYDLGENTIPILLEREYCQRTGTSDTYQCTILLKSIDEKAITKNTEFGIVILYDADGNDKYEGSKGEISTYTFKPIAPACATILECLSQLDKTIATKYVQGN